MPQGENSKYRQDVSIGHGKRISVYAATKRELNRKVAKLITDIETGTFTVANKATVAQVAHEWLPFHAAEKEIEDSTYLSYDQILRKHVNPLFGNLQMQRLTEHIISQKMAHRADLSSSTRRKIMLTLHLVIKHAKRLKIISQDPMEFLSLPTQRNETDRELYCMNIAESQSFAQACGGKRLENLFILALATGAREGELLALRKSDFVDNFSVMRCRTRLLKLPQR